MANAFNLFSLQQAPSNSTKWHAYNAGVKMGCWGLVIYAATGAICSGEEMACPEDQNPDLCLSRGKAIQVGCSGLRPDVSEAGRLSCVLPHYLAWMAPIHEHDVPGMPTPSGAQQCEGQCNSPAYQGQEP